MILIEHEMQKNNYQLCIIAKRIITSPQKCNAHNLKLPSVLIKFT